MRGLSARFCSDQFLERFGISPKVFRSFTDTQDFHLHFVPLLNLRQNIKTTDHFAENRMEIVQLVLWTECNEELRSVCVGAIIRHRENTGGIVSQPRQEFVWEFIAGTAISSSKRIASLDHESWHNAMERQPIKKRSPWLRSKGALS